MHDLAKKRILVLGEFGLFGRRVANLLARLPSVELVLGAAEPRRVQDFAGALGAPVVPVSAADTASLGRALGGASLVVNTLGPFYGADFALAEVCADAGVHYVDPAEAREHVLGIERLQRRAERSGALIVSGAGAVPAVSAALVELAVGDFERVTEIHTFLAPGARDHRELAIANAILGYLGASIRFKERGRWRKAYGWEQAQTVRFPEPIGKRRGYLCDLADLDLFPRHYGAQTVTVRAGIRSPLFSATVGTLALLKRWHVLRDMGSPLRVVHRLAGAFVAARGHGAGLAVELRGQRDGEVSAQTLVLVSRDDSGHAIAAAPLVALARRWLSEGVPQVGAMPCMGLLSWDDIRAEVIADGSDVVLVRSWHDVTAD